MITIENFSGTIAFITSVIGLTPQIFKAIQTRSTADVSMTMLINYFICCIAWVIYGGYANSVFVLFSNIFGLVSTIFLIFLKTRYDNKNKKILNNYD